MRIGRLVAAASRLCIVLVVLSIFWQKKTFLIKILCQPFSSENIKTKENYETRKNIKYKYTYENRATQST